MATLLTAFGFLRSFLGGMGWKILAALAVVATVILILMRAKNAGRLAERVGMMRQSLKSVEIRNEVERDVLRGGGPAAVDELHKSWSRD